jgi:hypothetical protein
MNQAVEGFPGFMGVAPVYGSSPLGTLPGSRRLPV